MSGFDPLRTFKEASGMPLMRLLGGGRGIAGATYH
jgi:hypothetical protein